MSVSPPAGVSKHINSALYNTPFLVLSYFVIYAAAVSFSPITSPATPLDTISVAPPVPKSICIVVIVSWLTSPIDTVTVSAPSKPPPTAAAATPVTVTPVADVASLSELL